MKSITGALNRWISSSSYLETFSWFAKNIFFWYRSIVKKYFTCWNVSNKKIESTSNRNLTVGIKQIDNNLILWRCWCLTFNMVISQADLLLDPLIPSLSSGLPFVTPPKSRSTMKAVTWEPICPYNEQMNRLFLFAKTLKKT